jgi:hypothetical protein
MARHWYGDQVADVVVTTGDQVGVETILGYQAVLAPGVTLWAYDYVTGERITDLMDATGTTVSSITSDSTGRIPRFRGPDGVERMLLGQDPAGLPPDTDVPRWTVLTTSYPDIIAGLRDRIAALEADSGGEYTSSAHPLVWTAPGAVETHVSQHPVQNLDGREQTVTAIRAAATLATTSTLTVVVYTVDLDTGVQTAAETITLTTATPAVVVDAPTWTVPDRAGVTVGVTVGTGSAADLTVQVMVK